MDIRYIRKNMDKQSSHDMMNILKDLIIKSDISTINNFSPAKSYGLNDMVYVKEGKLHRVYVCLVENSTPGVILPNEWRHYIERIYEEESKHNPMDIYEEKLVVNNNGLFNHKLDFDLFKHKNTFVAAFNSVQPRLRYGVDFTLTEDGVIKFLKPMCIGERVIFEIRHFVGKLFNNLFREVYVEESFTAIRRIRMIPIRYHGYRESSKVEVYKQNGRMLEENVDYHLNGAYIILNNHLNAGETLHITMWNKVLIKPTALEYIYDDENNVYKLGVNNDAQLTLTEIKDGSVMGNPVIELISEDGTLYNCKVTVDGRLVLEDVEPDIILADDNNKYKLNVNIDGEPYLSPIDHDFYKDIYLISVENNLFEINAENGVLKLDNIVNDGLLDVTLHSKCVIGDNGLYYELTVENGKLVARVKEIDYKEQKPIQYLNLISPNTTNFMFFATDDGHLAVRPMYIIDNSSSIIRGDNGDLYLIGMTNEGEIFSQNVRSAPFVAENKQISDMNNNLFELHVNDDGYIYTLNLNQVVEERIPVMLDSDAKDEYFNILDENGQLISYNMKKSTVLRDYRTGYDFALYVENNEIKLVRVQTDYYEKSHINLVTDHRLYQLYLANGVIKLYDTNIDLPEKEDVVLYMTNESGDKDFILNIKDGNINIE